mmetsp:Transcript_103748/g.268538  ORF Transcript_103748/g.268538 Transcript_103748/m.268538 type:complete len:224 (+) Transcript_103748:1-672(+)
MGVLRNCRTRPLMVRSRGALPAVQHKSRVGWSSSAGKVTGSLQKRPSTTMRRWTVLCSGSFGLASTGGNDSAATLSKRRWRPTEESCKLPQWIFAACVACIGPPEAAYQEEPVDSGDRRLCSPSVRTLRCDQSKLVLRPKSLRDELAQKVSTSASLPSALAFLSANFKALWNSFTLMSPLMSLSTPATMAANSSSEQETPKRSRPCRNSSVLTTPSPLSSIVR